MISFFEGNCLRVILYIMIRVKGILFFLAILLALQLHSQSTKVDLNMAKQFVSIFLADNIHNNDATIENIEVLFTYDGDIPNAYLVNLKPAGFVIVSSTNSISPILAFSFENNFAKINSDERNITLKIVKEVVLNDQNNKELTEIGINAKDVVYGPYVFTMWGQVNCYNSDEQLINVSNIYTPNNYAPGCVAISQITLMHHFSWPPRGMGAHAYTDNSGSSRGYYAANYADSQYDWAIMMDRYRAQESISAQRRAVGDVAFDAAISLYMDFESDGSTSNVNRIPTSLAHYFRFTSLYKDRYTSGFWSLLDSNMANKKPAILAISGTPGGHSVVCDGLKIEDGNQYYYHLNMGWWGVSNGWYKIRGSFNAGGYSVIDGAVMNIIPEPYVITPEISSNSSIAKIHWMYPENAEAEAFQLQVSIDNEDWQTISDNITDTCYSLAPNIEKSYRYRVRAKTNGFWYSNSWGNTVYLRVHYTSISENEKSIVNVYPNPFSSQLNLNFNIDENIEMIEIHNVTGKKMYNNSLLNNNSSLIIDTKNWKNGMYFISVKYKNHIQSVKTVKINN